MKRIFSLVLVCSFSTNTVVWADSSIDKTAAAATGAAVVLGTSGIALNTRYRRQQISHARSEIEKAFKAIPEKPKSMLEVKPSYVKRILGPEGFEVQVVALKSDDSFYKFRHWSDRRKNAAARSQIAEVSKYKILSLEGVEPMGYTLGNVTSAAKKVAKRSKSIQYLVVAGHGSDYRPKPIFGNRYSEVFGELGSHPSHSFNYYKVQVPQNISEKGAHKLVMKAVRRFHERSEANKISPLAVPYQHNNLSNINRLGKGGIEGVYLVDAADEAKAFELQLKKMDYLNAQKHYFDVKEPLERQITNSTRWMRGINVLLAGVTVVGTAAGVYETIKSSPMYGQGVSASSVVSRSSLANPSN